MTGRYRATPKHRDQQESVLFTQYEAVVVSAKSDGSLVGGLGRSRQVLSASNITHYVDYFNNDS